MVLGALSLKQFMYLKHVCVFLFFLNIAKRLIVASTETVRTEAVFRRWLQTWAQRFSSAALAWDHSYFYYMFHIDTKLALHIKTVPIEKQANVCSRTIQYTRFKIHKITYLQLK